MYFLFFLNIRSSNRTKFLLPQDCQLPDKNSYDISINIWGFLQYFKICIYLFIYSTIYRKNFSRYFGKPWLVNTCISSQRRLFMPLSWWQQAPLKRRLLSISRRFLEDFNFQFSVSMTSALVEIPNMH